MSMKAKPNTAPFKPPRDPSAFLDGADGEKAAIPPASPAPIGLAGSEILTSESGPRRGRGRVQKIFNFPEDLADRLFDYARQQSQLKGKRVSEKDVVVEALEKYLARR